MTLTTRLTTFFLLALAVVLVAFSLTFYGLARTRLFEQLNDRATSTLDTLIVVAEMEDDGLEWEPKDRKLQLHRESDTSEWGVFDQNGERVDGSPSPVHSLKDYASPGQDLEQIREHVTLDSERWRIVRRTLHHPHPEAVEIGNPAKPRFQALVFVTAWPIAPVQKTLHSLAWGLTGVSFVVWLGAALMGRWICRRALLPVSRMAEAVRGITATDLGERLPNSTSQDELSDLAIAFNELLTRLQDSFERQKRFTGEASHQLRTPLTAMLGQLEVALRRDRDPKEYQRVLSSARNQALRLRGIIEMLLFLARADAETRVPDLEPVDLVPWLSGHLQESWSEHPRSGDLKLELPMNGFGRVHIQPALLAQAIDNLIDNAFKYSPPHSSVSIQITPQSERVAIRIKDQGQGITAEDLSQVFTPFFRSIEVRRRGISGVGLGLAVTERIVTAFQGRIEVESHLGQGSEFTIYLPIQTHPQLES